LLCYLVAVSPSREKLALRMAAPSGAAERGPRRRALVIVITAAAAVLTYYLLPSSLDEPARRTAAIFLVAAVFWATEVLPLYATSLCVIAFEVLFLAHDGGLAGALPSISHWPTDAEGALRTLPYTTFFSSFASPIVILFMGGFLLAAAIKKHGVDRAIAARVLSPLAHRPLRLLAAVMAISAFFSMWMSNTATAAMMLALIAPLVRHLPEDDRYVRALVLGVAFGANIGGLGTPIGTPPNAIAMAALSSQGVRITFLDWMLLGVPLAVILLFVATFMLWLFYLARLPRGRAREPVELGHIEPRHTLDRSGRLTGVVLICAVLLWLTGQWHGLHPAVVALLSAAALTAFRLLDRRDIDSIDWNILLLMWGGLSLGQAIESSGLVHAIVSLPFERLGPALLALMVVAVAAALSTFMSNTAAANLVIPMAMAVAPQAATELAILVAFACSIAMAMPVSTPPNAIAFATGRIPVRSLLRAGGLITLIALWALLAGYKVMIPLILGR
jgi:solute carrier family 13 (sodium-dependent dicarboxylate transporter), member 2/3/5